MIVRCIVCVLVREKPHVNSDDCTLHCLSVCTEKLHFLSDVCAVSDDCTLHCLSVCKGESTCLVRLV